MDYWIPNPLPDKTITQNSAPEYFPAFDDAYNSYVFPGFTNLDKVVDSDFRVCGDRYCESDSPYVTFDQAA